MPSLKSVKMSLSSCSLSAEQMVLMKYASSTLRLRKFSGVLLMMVRLNLWVGVCFKCLAGSDLLVQRSCRTVCKHCSKLTIKTPERRH